MSKFDIVDLAEVEYSSTWDLQKKYFQQSLADKKNGSIPKNTFIICEHTPVYTLGKRGEADNILFEGLDLGAPVFRIERGGDVTFHGPGQLVGYPIFDLEQYGIGLREYIWRLEEAVIRTIAHYGLSGDRVASASGVWLDIGTKDERKICAVGVKSSRYVTMHGFAFNINTDLTWFQKIVPCGIQDKGVTSLANELGVEQDFEAVKEVYLQEFAKLFPAVEK